MADSDSEEENRQKKADRLQKAARLNDILGKIQDDKVSVRLEALKAMSYTFNSPTKSSNMFGVLSDKSYHDVFEKLFRVAVRELELHNKGTGVGHSTAMSRLEVCVEVVSTVVRVSTSKLKRKTVKAVCQHILDILPSSKGGYVGVFASHYLKTLATLFEHKPHAEQLLAQSWLDLAKFCLAGIDQYLDENDSEPRGLSRSFSGLGSSSSATNGRNSSEAIPVSRQNVDELFQIMVFLVSAPNAPLGGNQEDQLEDLAGDIVRSTIRFLQIPNSSVGQVHQLTFSIINRVLLFSRSNRIPLSQSIAKQTVPVICRLWQGRAAPKDEMINSVRDEMMMTLIHIHPYLEKIFLEQDDSELLTRLEDVADVLRADYARRKSQYQLHLDDIEFIDTGMELTNCHPFALEVFCLRPFNPRAERNWTQLQLIGSIEQLLRKRQQKIHASEELEVDDETPRKRQKLTPVPDRLLDPLITDDEDTRVAGLQIIPFVLHNCRLSTKELSAILRQLHTYVQDKRGNVAAWALLAIACCTYQGNATNIGSPEWLQLWQNGTRTLTFVATCRTASVLLHTFLAHNIVLFSDVAEDVKAMITTTDTNGPAILADSSISLMSHLLHARVTEVPGSSFSASQSVVRWLFSKWTPDTRSYALYEAVNVSPLAFTTLLRICLGLHRCKISWKPTLPCGVLGQAWQHHLNTKAVMDYLLLLEECNEPKKPFSCFSCPKHKKLENNLNEADNTHFHSIRKLVLELLSPKLTAIMASWKSNTPDSYTPVAPHVYSCAVNSSLTILLCMKHFAKAPGQQVQELQAEVSRFAEAVVTFVKQSRTKISKDAAKETRVLLEILLQAIQPFIPNCGTHELSHLAEEEPHMLRFFILIADGCVRPFDIPTSMFANDDMMDIDDEFSPQETQEVSEDLCRDFPRHVMGLEMESAAYHLMVAGKLILIAEMSNSGKVSSGIVPSSFYNHLLSLSQEDLILSSRLISDILTSELMTEDMDTNRLLLQLTDMLTSYSFYQCEVFLVLCLDTLVSTGPQWANNATMDELEGNALHFYTWIINAPLTKNTASPEVQKHIARLLFLLIRIDPEYAHESPLPSPKSCLFTLLEKENISVKFYVGELLPEIFGHFVLDTHDNVFVDILELLPSDFQQLEGIYFRMSVLAKLASRWSNLLRRCIYHIFETPGRLPTAVKHASKCLEDVAFALNVSGPRELFDLFAPQLLFTWTENIQKNGKEEESVEIEKKNAPNDTIKEIPFEIFGFPTLKDLVLAAQEELMGLVAMRGDDYGMQQIAEITGLEHVILLQNSFAKVMAYCVAQDTRTTKSGSSRTSTLESKIRTKLGQDMFYKLLNRHFVEIAAFMFDIMDQESDVEKYFGRSKDLRYASEALSSIKKLSSSKLALPPNQQPLISSKSFPAQILHLCSLTVHTHNTLYTRTLVTFMSRKLLGTMHPALGSLHSCSVLRKLRILVSLAGISALDGYPLEMVLQAARTFLVDPECADDAIGLVQYLLLRGAPHLEKNPSFVAGIGLSYLGSLKVFLQSSQPSTTQKSQFTTTMTAAQKFRTWFENHLTAYDSPGWRSELQRSFQTLIHAASKTESTGSADADSQDSNLLLQLLKDEKRGGNLLNPSSRKLALGMLCLDFSLPASFRRDFLGADKDAVSHAIVVWKSCLGQTVSDKYLSWAARVLGRAFTASGHVRDELLQESSLRSLGDIPNIRGEKRDSRKCILKILQDLTLDSQHSTVGLGESALRIVLSNSDAAIVNEYYTTLSPQLYSASIWAPYDTPPSEVINRLIDVKPDTILPPKATVRSTWLRELTIGLVQSVPEDVLLMALVPILRGVPGFAERVFPFVLHLTLSAPTESCDFSKKILSKSFNDWLNPGNGTRSHNLKILLDAILYLRTQPFPSERSAAQRARWLDIDYHMAARSATGCGMHKTALLFVEDSVSEPAKSSRRSSVLESPKLPNELLITIFENIDDPDMYYGVEQPASLESILARFEYEKDGSKSLAFRGAQFDSHIRKGATESSNDLSSLVKSLDILSLSGVSHALLQSQQSVGMTPTSLDSMFRTARKLEQWDIPVPPAHNSNTITLYKAFQAIHTSSDHLQINGAINEGLEKTMSTLVRGSLSANALHESLQTLASLTEMDEILSSQGSEEFEVLLARFEERSEWMKTGRFDDMNPILSCRGTTLSTVSRRQKLQNIMGVPLLDTRVVEVKAALLSSKLNRAHNALQESLSLATSMMNFIKPCSELGLKVEVSIHAEAANMLWDQGEMSSAISMLRALDSVPLLKEQTIPVGRSDLLWKIGYQISVARLETPDMIIEKYLKPALKELNGKKTGSEAGQVFHQFAVFCDQQLQDPDSLEDLERLQRLRKNKADEVEQYAKLIRSERSETKRRNHLRDKKKSETWLEIDDKELQRLSAGRENFLRQCLENYLLSLSASDEHDGNALRFSNLWLGNSENQLSNDAVAKHLSRVPSRKFARLMNQLTSRLQSNTSSFQQLLYGLVKCICQEHPYHGMYQIYSSTKTEPSHKDESATSRYKTTKRLAEEFQSTPNVASIWTSLQATNNAYCQLAGESNNQYKAGKKFSITSSPAAEKLQRLLAKYQVPPPTMNVPLAADLNYSKVPKMYKFDSSFAIAGGVSSPKILTAVASNGLRFKQLVKGGNDDLRQDAIMEQVFEQVSELLKTNRTTRQRNLTIRTYKVLPLSASAGVLEFVADTKPLHDYLIPAHERYNPKDMKPSECRRKITEAQSKSTEIRVTEFRNVTRKFQPAMRHWFTENFRDPDDWFARRLAYTRSTAAISMLGHVLGLGDRHGQNILLDEKSGEVVHIDLGIAFEMGRVLTIPEIVPFRLTRDIVDGMGVTKTEGVFRRCCEFTLEALRKEVYSIMTILDVLRYDPLYSWSISPVRLAKLQEEQSAPPVPMENANEPSKSSVNEPGEADRALTVVNKKLSKTLSVTATVNDLINQASDERNLALLFGGWAAYA